MTLLTELDAFFTEHGRCGDLDAGVDGPIVLGSRGSAGRGWRGEPTTMAPTHLQSADRRVTLARGSLARSQWNKSGTGDTRTPGARNAITNE